MFCAAAQFAAAYSLELAVLMDGTEIGTVESQEELDALVTSVEGTVSALLGREYTLSDRISCRLSVTPRQMSSSEAKMTKAIYAGIDEVEKQFVLYIDGVEAGSVSNLEQLHTAMEAHLDTLRGPDTVSAVYLPSFQYEYRYADKEGVLDGDALRTLLEGLPVETVDEVAYTEAAPYDTSYVQDDTLYIGEEQVAQPGQDGEILITVRITYVNGQEQSREVLRETVTAEPVTEVIYQGTAEKPVTASTGIYLWPVAGTVSSSFGPRNVSVGSSNHKGLDIAAPSGEYVYAADGGQVIFSGWSDGYGNLIQVQHDNGDVTYYAHLSGIDVPEGDLVYQGQLIGRVGMTGTATGYHLHFELRIDGTPVNPLAYLE